MAALRLIDERSADVAVIDLGMPKLDGKAGWVRPPPVELRDGRARLSPRETLVLSCAAEGMTATQIGLSLHISQGTVKTYLASAYDKLGVRGRSVGRRRGGDSTWHARLIRCRVRSPPATAPAKTRVQLTAERGAGAGPAARAGGSQPV